MISALELGDDSNGVLLMIVIDCSILIPKS